MEVLRGGGAVGDAQVVLGGELQVALQPAAGVLRPLPLVAVGQEEDQRRLLAPLGARGGDELVDQDLAGVGEVAELRLPEDQRAGGVDAVAVLEAERGGLGEGAVVDREGGARLGQRLERGVRDAGVRVVEDEVALAEGAARGVLPGQADRRAVDQDGGERQRLGVRPIDES